MSTKTKSVLRQVGTTLIPASEHYDPNASLATRQGVYVYDSFVENVRKHASAGPVGELALPYGDLEDDAMIAKIVADSGREHTPEAACYAIDMMTRRQPNGEDGDLLNNGYANLFPIIGGPVAHVYWDSGYRDWRVFDWRRADRRFFGDSRVF